MSTTVMIVDKVTLRLMLQVVTKQIALNGWMYARQFKS